MQILESVEVAADKNTQDFRFPVQYVNRPNLNFRGFCGTVASGVVHKGDEVRVLPSGRTSRIKELVTYDDSLEMAYVDQAVTLTLEDEIDVSRGDMIVKAQDDVQAHRRFSAHLVWMADQPMQPGKQYLFKFTTKVTTGIVSEIEHRIDVNTQERSEVASAQLNDIVKIRAQLEQPVVFDSYQSNRATGAFILIDRLSNGTVAAGMVIETLAETPASAEASYSQFELELNALIRKHFPPWQALDIGSQK